MPPKQRDDSHRTHQQVIVPQEDRFKLKEPNRRIKTVTDADFAEFFSSTGNLQFRCIMLLMREGGLRVGEVLGLWIQDVEFHRNGVWIRRRSALVNQALAKSLREGEERFVDLSPSLMALLDLLVLKHSFEENAHRTQKEGRLGLRGSPPALVGPRTLP